MKKNKIIVPKGIRYLGNWEDFSIPDEVCIIDKQITGCGFTEFCLTNQEDIILLSPRKILLENKEEQHKGEVYYAKSDIDKIIDFEKDLTGRTYTKIAKEIFKEDEVDPERIKRIIESFKLGIRGYSDSCYINHRPSKIIVTYDSFRYVKEALGATISDYRIIVDEFQSIFVDSKFKSSTEIELLGHLQGLDRICFVSATPMIDKYLEMLDEFKDLPFYELDWEAEEPSRVYIPKLSVHSCSKSVLPAAHEVIEEYLSGNFKSTVIEIDGELKEVVSKEAVLYVNSVKNICEIISRNGLTLENTNVLCSKTTANDDRVRKAFGLKKSDLKAKGVDTVLGSVPTKGEKHKMFTLCTRTVYLGADFYSTNARTFIFSDANVDSLTVDITLDLPQILGRQRLDENPWKNRADLYYKTLSKNKALSEEDFNEILEKKKKKTENLLSAYSEVSDQNKHDLAENYQFVAKAANYKDNYVAVNKHLGKDLVPVYNNLVLVSEMRSYEIQQIDYANRFRVFNALGDKISDFSIIAEAIKEIENIKWFEDKMKYVYNLNLSPDQMKTVLDNVSNTDLSKYYYSIPASRAGTLNYQRLNLEREYIAQKNAITTTPEIEKAIISRFSVGGRYSNALIKEELKRIYQEHDYTIKVPKASNLKEIFNVKPCKVQNFDATWENGLEILSVK